MHDDFRNRLIWGDSKLVMASLLKDFRGKIDLIYIDPPFEVGRTSRCRYLWVKKMKRILIAMPTNKKNSAFTVEG